MKLLSKSVDEYLAANGWSSNLFFEHAKAIFNSAEVKRKCTFEVGRTVIYIRGGGKMLKVYVHANGRSKEFMTFKSEDGDELKSFHYTTETKEITAFILGYLIENS